MPDTLPPLTHPAPVIQGEHTLASVATKIAGLVQDRPAPVAWWVTLGIAGLLLTALTYAIGYLLIVGVGIWGINIPVAWGFAIVNFVWWIGIGHAGTLISAILLLLHQKWRTSINRFAEAMTLFAVMCAGLFPLLHMGRPWFFYWLFPFPNRQEVWPQFRSPLTWDVFAVSTYFAVSLMFWYLGLLPDLAAMRDRARTPLGRSVYGVAAPGWRNSVAHWWRLEKAYLLLGGLATPLVLSVHTVVSWDFAIAIVPGWHSTVFPPYFVAGAIYSGFAMVLILAIPLRSVYGLQDFVTRRHLNNCAKLLLASGLVLSYGYFIEGVMAVYTGEKYDLGVQQNRWAGPVAPAYWLVIALNVVIPQALWSARVRNNQVGLFLVSLGVLVGMWLERWVIVVGSLQRDYLPSQWGLFQGTHWDYIFLFGSVGMFFFLFALFVRFLPMCSISELRDLLPKRQGGRAGESLEATPMPVTGPHGVLALFDSADQLIEAARAVRTAGYTRVEAFAPYPLPEAAKALGYRRSGVAFLVFVGGLVGGSAAFAMLYWVSAVAYRLNVGGRPPDSAPMFIPITFELTILTAALAGFLGVFVLCRLPRFHHPLFAAPLFARASTDGFYLCVEAADPKFDPVGTRQFLTGLNPAGLEDVTHEE